jgi:hypothetical protein
MTAAERQFERFVSAVQQFDCDDSASRFEETLAKLVAAGPASTRRAAPAESERVKVAHLELEKAAASAVFSFCTSFMADRSTTRSFQQICKRLATNRRATP